MYLELVKQIFFFFLVREIISRTRFLTRDTFNKFVKIPVLFPYGGCTIFNLINFIIWKWLHPGVLTSSQTQVSFKALQTITSVVSTPSSILTIQVVTRYKNCHKRTKKWILSCQELTRMILPTPPNCKRERVNFCKAVNTWLAKIIIYLITHYDVFIGWPSICDNE